MEGFRGKLARYAAGFGITLGAEALERMEAFWAYLLEENEKLNLTAIVDEGEAVVKHFLDSLTVLRMAGFPSSGSLVDVGSGAGFPGIPLALAVPGLSVTLVESVGKKADFLRRAAARLGIGVQVLAMRAEAAGRGAPYRESFDVAVARALAPLPVACEWCLPLVKVGGCFLAMRGAKGWDDLASATRAIGILGGDVGEVLPVELPEGAGQRVLVGIRKVRPSPARYPRPGGEARRKPL